jgi:hypothetical protein
MKMPAFGRKLVEYARYGAIPDVLTHVTPARPVKRALRWEKSEPPLRKLVMSFFAKS